MRVTPRGAALGLAAAFFLGAVWWWVSASAHDRPTPMASVEPLGSDRALEDASSASNARAPARDPALPQRGTPLPKLWDTLAPPARAGHGPSACRLALTTLVCASQRHALAFSRRLPHTLPQNELQALQAFTADPTGVLSAISKPTDQANADHVAERSAAIDRFCGPISDERRSEAFALLRQAALAGVPDAQTAYVNWGGGVMHLLPGSMSEPTFERWMEEAPTVLTRMLDAGHPEAPALLSEAYARDGFHGWLYPYDPMRAVAYGQLAQRIGQRRSLGARFVEFRRPRLTPAQRAEADRLAEQLFRERYAGRTFPDATDRRYLLGSLDLGVGPPPLNKADECAAPAPEVTP
jgi:hypothetical protein